MGFQRFFEVPHVSNPQRDFENTAIPVCCSLGTVAPKTNCNTVRSKNTAQRAVTLRLDSVNVTELSVQVETPRTLSPCGYDWVLAKKGDLLLR